MKVNADISIARELYDYLTFFAPNYKFHPKFKAGFWDGRIRLFRNDFTLYHGLQSNIHDFAAARKYVVTVDPALTETNAFTLADAEAFVKNLNLPPHFEIRDYQLAALVYAIRDRRNFLLLPTSAGKTLVAYFTIRYYLDVLGLRGIVILPDSGLLSQLVGDFREYSAINGWDVDAHLHIVNKDQKQKDSPKPVIVSTYQSAVKRDREYFEQFDFLHGEEADTFKAKSLVYIGESLVNARYRNGTTGSLDGEKVNELVLQGIFGPIRLITTIKELQDRKQASGLKISCLLLRPPTKVVKAIRRTDKKDADGKIIEPKWSWEDEKRLIAYGVARNTFVANLAVSRPKNVLVMFEEIDQGELLLKLIKERAESGRPIFYVDGDTKAEQRDEIRAAVEKCENAIVVCSRVFVRGTNIKRIFYIIRAALNKAKANNMQGIGRGLRKFEGKEHMILYEIVDDLRWKTWENYGVRHLLKRLEIYDSEGFNYKIHNVDIGDQ